MFRRVCTPLVFYYALTLALPVANGAGGRAFLAHALVVLTVPPVVLALFCLARAAVARSRLHMPCRPAVAGGAPAATVANARKP